ncbi:MAG: hypothetical protein ACI91G_000169 [Gammaproteobacteria bacterium]|jgi:hypothetical protein
MKKLTIGALVFAGTSAAVAAPQDYNRLDIFGGVTSTTYDSPPVIGSNDRKFEGFDFSLHLNKTFKEDLIFDLDIRRAHVSTDDDFAVDITTINTSLGYLVREDNYDGSLKLGYVSNDSDVIQTSASIFSEGAFAEVNMSYQVGETTYIAGSHRQLIERKDGQGEGGVTTVRLVGTYGEDEDNQTPYELAIAKKGDLYIGSFEILPFGNREDDYNQYGVRLERTDGDDLNGNAVYFFLRAYPDD